MPDIVQRVKYTVEVDTTELDAFKQKLDAVNTTVATLSTSFGQLKTNVDQGLLKSISSLNTRLTRTVTVGGNAAKAIGDMVAPLAGLNTSMATLAQKFDDFNKGLKAAVDDLKKVNDELKKIKKEQGGAGDEGEKAAKKTGMSWLRAFGVFQSAKYTIASVFQSIKEGAQQLDLEKILTQQFNNFAATISKAQEATAGMVSKGGLTKSFALMSSFGIPMDQFAENMELVQKMAIRTGQSSEFLSESFARGISRLSPLILDNLGIQVSLGDANEEYSRKTGILVGEMTKQDKTAALLTHTLGKLRENTRGVSLETGSAAAAVSRAEAAWDDFLMTLKEGGGDLFLSFDRIVQSQTRDVMGMVGAFDQVQALLEPLRKAGGLGDMPTELDKTQDRLRLIAKFAPDAAEPLDDFTKSADDVTRAMNQANAALSLFDEGFEKSVVMKQMGLPTVTSTDNKAFRDALDFARINNLAAKAQEDSLAAVAEIGAAYKGVVAPATRLAALAAARAYSEKRVGEYIADASKQEGDFFDTLKGVTVETTSLKAILLGIYDLAARTDKANVEDLKNWEAKRTLAETAHQQANDLFAVRDGTRLAELEMNKLSEKRAPLEKALAQAQEDYANAKDAGAKIEADRAIVSAQTALAEQDALRATAQAAIFADKAVLDSYQTMSKAKLREMKTFLEAQMAMLSFVTGPLASQKSVQLAEMQNTLKLIDGLLNKKSGGGGGSKKKPQSFMEWLTGLNPKDADDDIERMKTFRQILEETYHQSELLQGLSIPGKTRLDGVLGQLLGRNLGSATQQEFKAAQEQATSFREMLASLDVAGISLTDVFTDQEITNLDIFNRRLAELEGHFETLVQMSDGLNQVAFSLDNISGGFSTMYGELVGSDVSAIFSDLSASMGTFSDALRDNKDAYTLTTAAIPVIRSFTQNLIKNRQAQAAVEALMQGAAAWAAYAVGNVPGGAMHTAAAAMYLAVAGGVLRLPKGKAREDKPSNPAAANSTSKMRDVHVHFDGIIPTTEAERGALIQHMVRQAERMGG